MLAAALIVVSLFPGPTEAAREQARRIAEREGLQTSLGYDAREAAERPWAEPRSRPPPSDGGGEPRTERRRPEEPSSRGSGGSDMGSGWAKTVLVILGLVLLASLATGIVAALRRPPAGSTGSGGPTPPTAGSLAELPRSVLDPATALAQDGRFAEAVHRLLLDALGLLAARQRIPRHVTSREVLGLLTLGAADRAALLRLVDLVEISHFGGRPLGEAEWRAAHASFAALGGPGAGRA